MHKDCESESMLFISAHRFPHPVYHVILEGLCRYRLSQWGNKTVCLVQREEEKAQHPHVFTVV